MPKVKVLDYQVLNYKDALNMQEDIRHMISIREEDNTVLLLEHPPTITFGMRVHNENLFLSKEECERRGIELIETTRGGDITFHGHGQLIIYPILNLKDFNYSIVSFIEMIEQTIISTLKKYNLNASTKPKYKGVWIDNKKIASIGLNVKKYISIHGAAFNINTDLSFFDLINPCGLGVETTSMEKELGRKIDIAEVKQKWIDIFKQYTATDINYSRK